MTYAAHAKDFHGYAAGAPAPTSRAARPGVFRWLVQAFTRSREREADRQIAAFMARSGGRFTDSLERELMHRLTTRDWTVPR